MLLNQKLYLCLNIFISSIYGLLSKDLPRIYHIFSLLCLNIILGTLF